VAQFDKITQEPGVMGGKACIRGVRVTVGAIVGQIGAGRTIDEVLGDYPTSSGETLFRPFATQLGLPKSAKPYCPMHEASCRYESFSLMGDFSSESCCRG
jgi:uncharacterized protein (DUF433 family)